MHELSIAMAIVEQAGEEAERLKASRVAAIHLKLGPLSGVVKEALLASYDMATEGSLLAGSRLVIIDAELRAWCPTCEADRAVVSVQEICCQECGTPTPKITSGRDLEVVAMEIVE